MEPKKPYLSKTLIFNLIVAACAMFYPAAVEFLQSHPSEVMIGFSVVNIVLRLVTKNAIELY